MHKGIRELLSVFTKLCSVCDTSSLWFMAADCMIFDAMCSYRINTLSPWKFKTNLREVMFKPISVINGSGISFKIALKWIAEDLEMISQDRFRLWLGIIRQQDINWINIDPDLCRHMASLGHNKLINAANREKYNFQAVSANRFGWHGCQNASLCYKYFGIGTEPFRNWFETSVKISAIIYI